MERVPARGAEIPTLGLGTWMIDGRDCVEAVETALDLGYRHIDTAQVYGNEAAVGAGIAAAAVDRDAVFLTTKLARANLQEPALKRSVMESLDRLDTGYVDLLLVHWPHPRIPVEETLAAMADLKDDGVVGHLGVSNFTSSQLRTAVESVDEPLVTDQVMYNPYKDQAAVHEYCLDNDMAVTAYSPLARGGVLDDPVLTRIGDRYEKAAAQVALRWLVQQDNVVAIPKASSRAHLEQNIAVFDFSLTATEMTEIDDLSPGFLQRVRNLGPAVMRHNPL